MPSAYVLLTRTNTIFATTLHGFTKNRYIHSSIALDRELEQLYSFGRLNPDFILPGGFITENIHKGVFARCKMADSMVLEVPMSQESYDWMTQQLAFMYRRKKRYEYSILGLITAGFGVPYIRPYKYFCSHFVASMLERSGAVKLPKSAAVMRPEDLMNMGLKVVYEGPLHAAANSAVPRTA